MLSSAAVLAAIRAVERARDAAKPLPSASPPDPGSRCVEDSAGNRLARLSACPEIFRSSPHNELPVAPQKPRAGPPFRSVSTLTATSTLSLLLRSAGIPLVRSVRGRFDDAPLTTREGYKPPARAARSRWLRPTPARPTQSPSFVRDSHTKGSWVPVAPPSGPAGHPNSSGANQSGSNLSRCTGTESLTSLAKARRWPPLPSRPGALPPSPGGGRSQLGVCARACHLSTGERFSVEHLVTTMMTRPRTWTTSPGSSPKR